MKNKLIKITITLFLFLSGIYIPLLVYSSISFLLKSNSAKNIIVRRERNEDIPQKKKAISEGYLPYYLPNQTKKYLKNTGIYPIGSLPHTDTYLCNEGYGLIKFKTDRFGLRNKEENWNKLLKKENIFVIGDSFTQGQCVDDEDTIPQRIASMTSKNIINLASADNSPYQYIALIESFIKPIISNSKKNNWVVLNFYRNDDVLNNLNDEKLLKEISPILEISQKKGEVFPSKEYNSKITKLIKNNFPHTKKPLLDEVNKGPTFTHDWPYQIFTFFDIRQRIKKLIPVDNKKIYFDNRDLMPTTRSIRALSNSCKNKCKPIVVYIPNSQFWAPHETKNTEYFKKLLSETSKELSIPFIDGELLINIDDRRNYAPKGLHLSKEGYEKIAQGIYSLIEE